MSNSQKKEQKIQDFNAMYMANLHASHEHLDKLNMSNEEFLITLTDMFCRAVETLDEPSDIDFTPKMVQCFAHTYRSMTNLFLEIR